MKFHIKKDDNVMVIAGKDRGESGRVLEMRPHDNKAIVEGVNIISRHTKPTTQNPDGGIIKKEAPIHLSNLMLLDPKSNTPTRVGRKQGEDGKMKRYAKKTGEFID